MTGGASGYLALGHAMAKQYQRDNGASYLRASFAQPAVCKLAMQTAEDEQHYYAKCHALGLDAEVAKGILDQVVAAADQRGLPLAFVWERAWELAIDRSMK